MQNAKTPNWTASRVLPIIYEWLGVACYFVIWIIHLSLLFCSFQKKKTPRKRKASGETPKVTSLCQYCLHAQEQSIHLSHSELVAYA